MNSTEVILWGLGIIVSVLLAFLAVKKIRKSRDQKATARDKSTVIQSGRDTHIK
ncbi:hypothetical protein V9K92_10365 [Phyllobacterium sp. CCNWLW109]|uniref:hypothetical protein n=1 Tax=Phyllobacterium sp. CCNWLW109 TaxID=3127479 RepID=UPI003076917A